MEMLTILPDRTSISTSENNETDYTSISICQLCKTLIIAQFTWASLNPYIQQFFKKMMITPYQVILSLLNTGEQNKQEKSKALRRSLNYFECMLKGSCKYSKRK